MSNIKQLEAKATELACRLADMAEIDLSDAIDQVIAQMDEQIQHWENLFCTASAGTIGFIDEGHPKFA